MAWAQNQNQRNQRSASQARRVESISIVLPLIGRLYGNVSEGTDAKEATDAVARQNGYSLRWVFNEKYDKYELIAITDSSGTVIAQKDSSMGFHFSVGDGVIPVFIGADGDIRKFADFDDIPVGGRVKQIIIELVDTVFDPKTIEEMTGVRQRGLLERLQEAHGGAGSNPIVLPDRTVDADGSLAYLSFVNVKTGEAQLVCLKGEEEVTVLDFIKQNNIPHNVTVVYEIQQRIFDCPSAADILYAAAQQRSTEEKNGSPAENILMGDISIIEGPPPVVQQGRDYCKPVGDLVLSAPSNPQESVFIRLLMNPAERRLWGRIYGLPGDEDAPRVEEYFYQLLAKGHGNRKGERISKGGSSVSEKVDRPAPQSVMFGTISGKQEPISEGTVEWKGRDREHDEDLTDGEGEKKCDGETSRGCSADKFKIKTIVCVPGAKIRKCSGRKSAAGGPPAKKPVLSVFPIITNTSKKKKQRHAVVRGNAVLKSKSIKAPEREPKNAVWHPAMRKNSRSAAARAIDKPGNGTPAKSSRLSLESKLKRKKEPANQIFRRAPSPDGEGPCASAGYSAHSKNTCQVCRQFIHRRSQRYSCRLGNSKQGIFTASPFRSFVKPQQKKKPKTLQRLLWLLADKRKQGRKSKVC